MPTDRRITIRLEPDRREEGSALRTFDVWASKKDADLESIVELGAQRQETLRVWRIRWNETIYNYPLIWVDVVDEGQVFDVRNLVEVTDQGKGRPNIRRRWMDLTGVLST